MIDDPWTIQLESLMLEIAKTAEENKKEYFFGGGMSVDLAIGEFTRDHEDLDFHPLDTDTSWWTDWFKNKGFIPGKDPDMKEYPNSFEINDNQGKTHVDMWPVKPDEDGTITMLWKGIKHDRWDGHSWQGREKVVYKNVPIWIENPKNVIEQKLRHSKKFKEEKLPEKHQHDLDNYNRLLKTKYGEVDLI